MAIFSWYELGK